MEERTEQEAAEGKQEVSTDRKVTTKVSSWLKKAQSYAKKAINTNALNGAAEELRKMGTEVEARASKFVGMFNPPHVEDEVVDLENLPHLTQQDVDALNLDYITQQLIIMSFPCNAAKRAKMPSGNSIEKVSAFLNTRHPGKYMIWNLSEDRYNDSYFANQVLEFKFPGHPAPPLGMLFKICTSIENWLDADKENVAVIHCLTGKGRSSTVAACFLAWRGVVSSPIDGLTLACRKRGYENIAEVCIPSQQRYVKYFSNMMDGVKPRSQPLLLRRVIMNTIPKFGTKDGTGLILLALGIN